MGGAATAGGGGSERSPIVILDLTLGDDVVIGDPRKPLGTIRVLAVSRVKTRLSFDFPHGTAINRRELAQLKVRQLGIDDPAEADST